MNRSAKITSKGQITLPVEIRKSLGLSAGDKVDFVQNAAGKFELRTRKGKLADPGDFSDHLIGEINKQHGCRTTMTFDKAASRSPDFSELKG